MPDTNKSYELLLPEGDKNVGGKVFQLLAVILADKVRLGLHDKWNRNYKLRRNKHWKTKTSAALPLVSANVIFTHIQRTTNTLTDNNPTFNVAAVGKIEEDQKDVCLDLQRTAEHWWLDQEQQDKLESSVLNGETYGVCIEKVVFNEELEGGLGDAQTVVVDPFYFGWYPVNLKDISELQSSEAVVHFYPKSVRRLRAKYPKLADKIKPDSEILKDLNDDRRDINAQGDKKTGNMLVTIQNIVKSISNFISGADSLDDEETVVCEMWVKDNTRVKDDKPQTDSLGQEYLIDKLKYTGGIRYVLACSGGVVLEDKDNPNINLTIGEDEARQTYLYDKFPFYGANSVKDTASAWGISDIEQLEALNMELNKSLSQLVLEKDKSARRKIINPRDSGVENSEFTNYPGIIRPTTANQGAGIRYLDLPPSSVDIEKSITLFKDLFFLIAGTFDLDQAQVGGREVIAYKAIAALLERAATTMRGKIRSYGRLIRERGRMYLSQVHNFYTEERWISYTEQNGERAAKAIKGTRLITPAKLTVVSGSTLPISRVQQREEALTLFKGGAIDRQELLEKLDWGNRAEVLKRMEAGPLGGVIDKLEVAGIPPHIMEYIRSIVDIDQKQLRTAIEKGQFPPFEQFMTEFMQEKMSQGGQGQSEKPEDAEKRKTEAEIKKLEAEAALTTAQVQTEAVKQEVALSGVEFDEQQMKIKRAEAVSKMEGEIKSHDREDFKLGADMVSKINNEPGFNDRGTKSDNKV